MEPNLNNQSCDSTLLQIEKELAVLALATVNACKPGLAPSRLIL